MKVHKSSSVGSSALVARQIAELAAQRAYTGLPSPGLRLKMIAYQVRQAWTHRSFGKELSNTQLKV